MQGHGSELTERGHALVNAEDLALSRLAPQIEALRAELGRAFDAALGPKAPTLTLFASHDLALPALREQARRERLHLDLRFLGSVDSLRALAAGRCLVAGFHAPLLAPAGSGYARQLKPLLTPGLHKLIGFAKRTQGLIFAPGNPLRLTRLADAAAPSVRFIARQPGSGTRLLTDALLADVGLDPAALPGVQRHVEESHLAVAAAVACGVGDAGVGIEAAARAFGLDFVPLAVERYCFVCLKPALDHPAVQAFRSVLHGNDWQEGLRGFAGYEADTPGHVLRLTEALPWWDEVVGPRSGDAEPSTDRRREREA